MIAAAAGVTVGAAGATLWAAQPPALPICGTYELLSFVPNGGKEISGQLVYKPDGSMSTHFVVKRREGDKLRSMYTGCAPRQSSTPHPSKCSLGGSATHACNTRAGTDAGKWWLHDATTLNPPHGGALVEHDVHASSHQDLIGQTMRQSYHLSRDGRTLTTTHASFAGATLARSATLEWRRL